MILIIHSPKVFYSLSWFYACKSHSKVLGTQYTFVISINGCKYLLNTGNKPLLIWVLPCARPWARANNSGTYPSHFIVHTLITDYSKAARVIIFPCYFFGNQGTERLRALLKAFVGTYKIPNKDCQTIQLFTVPDYLFEKLPVLIFVTWSRKQCLQISAKEKRYWIVTIRDCPSWILGKASGPKERMPRFLRSRT